MSGSSGDARAQGKQPQDGRAAHIAWIDQVSRSAGVSRSGVLLRILAALALLGIGAHVPAAEYAPEYDEGYDATTAATRFLPPEGREPYPVRIIDRSTFDAYHFDPAEGKPATISYTVGPGGRVRVRLVRREDHSIVLRTIQDWTLSHYGQTYEIEWDGNDASGNPVDRKKMFVAFEGKDSVHERVHMDHRPESCRDPVITIEQPIVSSAGNGFKNIIVKLDQEEVNRGNGMTIEGRLYLDFELVEKVLFPAGATRFVFNFNAGELAAGEHLLTVNIDDLEDHVGAASLHLSSNTQPLPAARLLSVQD